MRSALLTTLSLGFVALVIACSGSDSTSGTSTNPTNPPGNNNGSSGSSGTSGTSGTSSGASGTSGTSGASSGTSGTSGAADAGSDGANGDGTCGKPGDTGNSKGVGKYCTGFAECLGNKDAQLCATAGDPKATFCTRLCKKGDGESVCGEATECVCDPNGGGQCGCTPKACLD